MAGLGGQELGASECGQNAGCHCDGGEANEGNGSGSSPFQPAPLREVSVRRVQQKCVRAHILKLSAVVMRESFLRCGGVRAATPDPNNKAPVAPVASPAAEVDLINPEQLRISNHTPDCGPAAQSVAVTDVTRQIIWSISPGRETDGPLCVSVVS
jgi:hypothetical protein